MKFIGLFFIAFFIFGCHSENTTLKDKQANKVDKEVKNPDKIIIVTEEFPPYNYTKDGLFQGHSTIVAKKVFRELGLPFTPNVMAWKDAYRMAEKKKNTLIFTIARNETREKLFKWIGKITTAKYYFISLKNRTDIKINNLEDAKKYKIATLNSGVREQYLLKMGFEKGKNIISLDRSIQAMKMLLKGRVDLWATNNLVAEYLLEENGHNKTELHNVYLLEEISKKGYYMAFGNETSDEVVNKFRKAFEKVHPNK